jgi:hypothetical protein
MVIRVLVGSVYRIIYFVWIIVYIIRRNVCLNACERHNVPIYIYIYIYIRITFVLLFFSDSYYFCFKNPYRYAACLLQFKVVDKSWRIVLIMCFSRDITNNNTQNVCSQRLRTSNLLNSITDTIDSLCYGRVIVARATFVTSKWCNVMSWYNHIVHYLKSHLTVFQ